jgi:PPP family 3-phenylpropionic acid transporter
MAPSLPVGLRLSTLYAASFVGIGVHLAFFPVWLESEALSPSAIGLVIAIPVIVRIVLTAPLLSLLDGRTTPRRLLIASHAGQALGFPVLLVLDGTASIAVAVALIAAAQAAIMPGNDLVTTEAVRRQGNLHYGRIRVWGSVAFLAATIATGYLVDALGPDSVIWALAAAPLLAILATHLALPPEAGPRQEGAARLEAAPAPSRRLPAILWLIMIAVALAQASHGAIYAFGSIHWRETGFSDAAIGYFWAIGVAVEIVLFVVLGRTVGSGSNGLGLLMIGGAAVVVRFVGMSLDPGLWTTVLLQALHGLTFGATHLGGMAALTALAPSGARGQAQGTLAALLALGTAAATVASGPIYREWGALVFAAMAPLGILSAALAGLAARRLKGQPQSAGEGG